MSAGLDPEYLINSLSISKTHSFGLWAGKELLKLNMKRPVWRVIAKSVILRDVFCLVFLCQYSEARGRWH